MVSDILIGSKTPFAEPAWFGALSSPYYKASHRKLQRFIRQYVEENIAPNVDGWEEAGEVPFSAKRNYFEAGLGFQELPEEYLTRPTLPGGVSRDEWDIFHVLVKTYEINRICSGGVIGGLGGALAIGVPPIVEFASAEQKDKWLPGIASGKTSFCLGATEPTGGSDLANLRTTAKKTPDGQSYIVNGNKVGSSISMVCVPILNNTEMDYWRNVIYTYDYGCTDRRCRGGRYFRHGH